MTRGKVRLVAIRDAYREIGRGKEEIRKSGEYMRRKWAIDKEIHVQINKKSE